MKDNFVHPNFSKGDLELRVENDEVLIYGNKAGLETLANFCLKLARKSKTDHIHLEDYELLTPNSKIGVVAFFE
jgi:hypothetical protein